MYRTKEQIEADLWMPRWPVGCETRQRESPVWSRTALRDIGAQEFKVDSVRTAEKRIGQSTKSAGNQLSLGRQSKEAE
jgi:hypothetical protein